MLAGGTGADRLVFASVAETGLGLSRDQINDVTSGSGDSIDLRGMGPGLHFITTGLIGAAGDGSIRLITVLFVAGDLILQTRLWGGVNPALQHDDACVFGLFFRLDVDGDDTALDQDFQGGLDAVAHVMRLGH